MIKRLKIIIITIIFVIVFFFIFENTQNYIINQKVVGGSMEPLINNGEDVKLYLGYYKKNNIKPKKGDIIIYRYGNNPLIKQIKATDKDTITGSGDNIYINGLILANSVGNTYKFNKYEMKMTLFHIKNNKLPKNSYLIFGDNTKNSIDSRKFGAISGKDIIGKIISPNWIQ